MRDQKWMEFLQHDTAIIAGKVAKRIKLKFVPSPGHTDWVGFFSALLRRDTASTGGMQNWLIGNLARNSENCRQNGMHARDAARMTPALWSHFMVRQGATLAGWIRRMISSRAQFVRETVGNVKLLNEQMK